MGSMEVEALFLEREDEREDFSFPLRVVDLVHIHLSAGVANWVINVVAVVVLVALHENSAERVLRSICDDVVGSLVVRWSQDGWCHESLPQSVECNVAIPIPLQRLAFRGSLGQSRERDGCVCVVLDVSAKVRG